MAAEFSCVECGRTVTRITLCRPLEFGLCFLCLEMPGWFRDPQKRAFLCSGHDGVEAWERGGDAPAIILMRDTD